MILVYGNGNGIKAIQLCYTQTVYIIAKYGRKFTKSMPDSVGTHAVLIAACVQNISVAM